MSDTGQSGGARGRRAEAPPRLDVEMVARGLAGTRARAQGLILAGRVLVSGEIADKCGAPVRPNQSIEVLPGSRRFASRGGLKLDGAFEDLGLSAEGLVALDVGASTGGFTDCLLRRGASRVYAADVGRGLLDDSLRRDPRVVVLEGVNFRYASPGLLPEKVSLATVDVSFISLRHILPALRPLLAPEALVVALVKPQFEAGRSKVGKGGVVRDDAARREAVRSVSEYAGSIGFAVAGEAESRVRGPKGNREVFLLLRWTGDAAAAAAPGVRRSPEGA